MKLIPHKGFIRRKLEAWLIRRAAGILIGRNVQRSAVVSRRDNNDMWGMAERLESIATRINSNYTKRMENYERETSVYRRLETANALLQQLQERLDPHRDAELWGKVCDHFTNEVNKP